MNDWRERARCLEAPSELFERDDSGLRGGVYLGHLARRRISHRLERGEQPRVIAASELGALTA